MTIQEAIEIINAELSATEEGYETAVNAGCKHSEDYEAWLVACRMAFEALKKQVPKNIRLTGMEYWKYECPSCGTLFTADTETFDYCPDCGQAIESEAEE